MKIFENTIPESLQMLLENFNEVAPLAQEIQKWGFYLAGGTGLALQIGHRISNDIDFFTSKEFNPEALAIYLKLHLDYKETLVNSGTLYCELNQIKVSFIYYDVPLTHPTFNFKSVVVADWHDILAEKFKTLSQRGSRKDFYDIYACFNVKKLSISDGIDLFRKRFDKSNINYYHILKSLVYFEDADKEPDLLLHKPVKWKTVKDFFLKNIREFEKCLLK